MTIICGYVRAGSVWIGSDHQWTAHGGCRLIPSSPKWIYAGDAAIGISGDARILSIMHRHGPGLLAARAHAFDMWANLATLLAEHGQTPVKDDKEGFRDHGASILYACGGRLWDIDCTGACIEVSEFWARGSGRDYALGAYNTFASIDGFETADGVCGGPQRLVHLCVHAAIAYDTNCGGSAWTHELKP